jgi:hypothetical protein
LNLYSDFYTYFLPKLASLNVLNRQLSFKILGFLLQFLQTCLTPSFLGNLGSNLRPDHNNKINGLPLLPLCSIVLIWPEP